MNHILLISSGASALVLTTMAFLAPAKSALTPFTAPATSAAAVPGNRLELSRSKIYWEYNSTANDLGVHVSLDGEHWKKIKIFRPDDSLIFDVRGLGPYSNLGLTELFFEGAEPSLNEYPLAQLLAQFPEGEYEFEGLTTSGEDIEGEWDFSHAIPAGPRVQAQTGPNNLVRIHWTHVTTTPLGFPVRPVNIVGYQVIVGTFQVTLPPSATSVTVPREFVAALLPGPQDFEVLAIEASGNQTLTEGSFNH